MANYNTTLLIGVFLLAKSIGGIGVLESRETDLEKEVETLSKRLAAVERHLERQDKTVTFSGKRVFSQDGKMTHVGEKVPIIFAEDIYHHNSGYSVNDGKFYCERGGLYLISVTITAFMDTAATAFLYVNDKKVITIFSGMNAKDAKPSGTRDIGLHLSAGDKVWVGGNNRGYNHHCYFSYVLLREKFSKHIQ